MGAPRKPPPLSARSWPPIRNLPACGFELAQTLFAIDEDDSARHNFELVLGGAANNPALQTTARNYINAIEARRRWDFTSFLTVAPSTNLNHGTESQTVYINGLPFTLDDGSVQKSGVGVYGGFQGGYRLPVTTRLDLVMTVGSQAKRYAEGAFNDTLVNASIGPKLKFEKGYLGVYATADHHWVADAAYNWSYGGLISGGYRFGPADLVSADAGCTQRNYQTNWRGTDMSYQNGHGCFAGLRAEHYFDSRTYVRGLANGGIERTSLAHLNSTSIGGGIGLYHEFAWGISLYGQAMYTDVKFDGKYPGFNFARHDQRTSATVNLTKRDFEIFGLAPQLQYTYTHNDSNVPLTVYDEHGAALTLTKRF